MASDGQELMRTADARSPGGAAPGSRAAAARVILIALVTAGAVVIAGGGDAFWLCVPAVLLGCAGSRTRLESAVTSAAVAVSAAAAAGAWSGADVLHSVGLALVVLVASATILIGVRERLERERDAMRDSALSDPLTGIANRRSLLARAEYEITRHARARRSFALVMLDLDGFKLLNDRFGHTAGDDLLRDVATALKRSTRGQDTVARIGGDEFCVLAPETEEAGIHRLEARIGHGVGTVTAGVETIHASVGVAVFPSDGVTAASLLQAADQRLLSAKRKRHPGRARRRAA